jgi:hypothetical protein
VVGWSDLDTLRRCQSAHLEYLGASRSDIGLSSPLKLSSLALQNTPPSGRVCRRQVSRLSGVGTTIDKSRVNDLHNQVYRIA